MKGFIRITEKQKQKNGEDITEIYFLNVKQIEFFTKGTNFGTEITYIIGNKGFFYFKAEETIDEVIKLIEQAQ